MPRWIKALFLGLMVASVGLLLLATPWGQELEETFGLDALFMLRGPRPAPPEVVIVSLDKPSADHLRLPNEPHKWPRSLHAKLVDNLARHGAAVISFDVIFDEPRAPQQDVPFAQAVQRAGNVVLFEYLKKENLPLTDRRGATKGEITVERLISPLPALVQASAATAPFPLPKVPVKVSQFWLYKTGAGDHATLPLAAFQIYALPVYDEFIELLRRVSPAHAAALPRDRAEVLRTKGVQKLIQDLKVMMRQEPQLAERLAQAAAQTAGAASLLRSLVHLYRDGDSRYLNFYGPPRHITTLSYYKLLQADNAERLPVNLRGAAVFVGVAESLQHEQRDGFYTAFSQDSGLDVSGVEIAATAFANMLQDLPVIPLDQRAQLALVAAWGLLIGFVCMGWRALAGIAVLMGLSVLYFAWVYLRFATDAHWYPLIIPIMVQAPLALVAALLWHYLATNRERRHIRRAFGFYIPDKVVDDLARNLTDVRADKRVVYGVCLATDAEKYTGLAETLPPEQLGALMNRYYAAVFQPVHDHGGFVSDVVGDSMLAIWTGAEREPEICTRACHAALDVLRAVEQFNRSAGEHILNTRLGLHAGPVLLGNIGAIDHYEYRAVGDIVNTATRLQALNKVLGTRILVAHESVSGLNRFQTRDLGVFLLSGKTIPLGVSELLCSSADADEGIKHGCTQFAAALADYRERRWHAARDRFRQLLEQNSADAPARFYLQACERCLAAPVDAAWSAVVRIDAK